MFENIFKFYYQLVPQRDILHNLKHVLHKRPPFCKADMPHELKKKYDYQKSLIINHPDDLS